MLFSKSNFSVSCLVFKTNHLVSILFPVAITLSYTVYLTTSLLTTLFSLLKSAGTFFNFSTFFFSSIPDFKPAESYFASKVNVSTPVAFSNLFLLHN